MSDKELEEYLKTTEPNFNSHIEKGTIEMSNEYYNLLEERMIRLLNENKQLKELCNKYEEEHKKEFNTWLQGQKVLKDLEEWLKNKIDNFDNGVKDTILHEQMTISIIYDYIQLLKEKYK